MILSFTKKITNKYFVLALSGLFILGSAGCKKDKDDDTTAGSGTGATATTPDFIKNGSSKIEFTDPTMGTYSKNVQQEENFKWTGNAPGNQYQLTINQAIARKEGTVAASGFGASMKWGSVNMVVTGNYVLSKDANGKWVSTLTNGTGTETIGTGGATTVYSGIEFKVTWPQ